MCHGNQYSIHQFISCAYLFHQLRATCGHLARNTRTCRTACDQTDDAPTQLLRTLLIWRKQPLPSVSNRYFYLWIVPRSGNKCYNLACFFTPTPIKDSVGDGGVSAMQTIRSVSNGREVSCGIFATIAHFSAPICRKPLIILKATTSLPHLIKTT